MSEAYIVAYGRSAAGKSKIGGAMFHERPDEVAAKVLKGVLERVGGSFEPSMVDDVIVGNAFPEGVQGPSIARGIAGLAGVSVIGPGGAV